MEEAKEAKISITNFEFHDGGAPAPPSLAGWDWGLSLTMHGIQLAGLRTSTVAHTSRAVGSYNLFPVAISFPIAEYIFPYDDIAFGPLHSHHETQHRLVSLLLVHLFQQPRWLGRDLFKVAWS